MHDDSTQSQSSAGYSCCGGKSCCANNNMDRREFFKSTALAAGALGLMGAAGKAGALTPEEQAAFDAWTATLLEPGTTRVYTGKELDKIAMPMGGIGCGQLYLGGRGDIVSWQILNNFNTGAKVHGPNFAVWAQSEGGPAQAKILVEGERDGLPGFERAAFRGEYPLARIDFEDTREGWPLRVKLESYSPFIPLNAKDSGLPAVVFRYELENTSATPVNAVLLGAMPNLCGWDGYGALPRPEHPDFTGHENRALKLPVHTAAVLSARGGSNHYFDDAVTIATNDSTVAYRMRLLGRARVEHGARLPKGSGDRIVYWSGDSPQGGVGGDLLAALKRVEEGAGIVLAGMDMGALAACAAKRRRNRAKTFEDWENGDYDGWDLDGNCFSSKPVDDPLPGQQPVTGQRGKAYFNSFFGGDDTTGTATSRAFKLRHDYIHLLVGGGNFPGEACIQLLVDDRPAREATGDNTEQIKPAVWSVAEFKGKEVRFRILDTRKGGWGHILVDDIVFSSSPSNPFEHTKVPEEFRDALPVSWRSITREDNGVAATPGVIHGALDYVPVAAPHYWRLHGMKLVHGAEILLKTKDGAPLVVAGTHGKGRIVLCMGNPADWAPWLGQDGDRKLIAALVAQAAGTNYRPLCHPDEDHVYPDVLITNMPHFGSTAIALSGAGAQCCTQFKEFGDLWSAFSVNGALPPAVAEPAAPGHAANAAVATPAISLAPGEKRVVEIILAWHFPNRMRTGHYGWGPGAYQYDYRLGNQYNNHFKNAGEVAAYVAEHGERLRKETLTFHDAFYSTTAPRYFLDAITANLSIVRSPIYVWLEDGTVGGFEGSDACCPMNCTHVYNYAMAMPYLFPDLECNVREIDLLINRDPQKNFVPHRTTLPLSVPRLGDEIGGPQHHALDGELGALLKLYREWKVCGDKDWLGKMYPAAKAVMQHVLDDHDVVKDGVLRGEQPNTYDTHLFGSNMFIGGLYLGALRAIEELALVMGDETFATVCRARYEKGHRGYEGICWNGEYYFNVFNAPNATPETYNGNNCYGNGCHADQVLGQWWAHHLGLGHLCDPGRAKTMLESIYKYNWRPTLKDHHHNQRVFAEGDEKGLLIITWPKEGRPERPTLYCDEVWTGIEYEVAGAMLYEGMVTEALQIVRGARDRYTGNQRNPWSEIECGGHYARAMSAYALLQAIGGLDYDAHKKRLGLAPRINRDDFRTYFSTGTGWGVVSLARAKGKARLKIEAHYGTITLQEIALDLRAATAKPLGAPRPSIHNQGNTTILTFRQPIQIVPGTPLAITLA